jgi:hypothetical protein
MFDALPPLPPDVVELQGLHGLRGEEWAAALRRLKRSMIRAMDAGAGQASFPSAAGEDGPRQQANALGQPWPRIGINRCRLCTDCQRGTCMRQRLQVLCQGCIMRRRCDILVCRAPWRAVTASFHGSITTEGAPTAEDLHARVAALTAAGAALRESNAKLSSAFAAKGLDIDGVPSRDLRTMEQVHSTRQDEEEDAIEQARAQLVVLSRDEGLADEELEAAAAPAATSGRCPNPQATPSPEGGPSRPGVPLDVMQGGVKTTPRSRGNAKVLYDRLKRLLVEIQTTSEEVVGLMSGLACDPVCLQRVHRQTARLQLELADSEESLANMRVDPAAAVDILYPVPGMIARARGALDFVVGNIHRLMAATVDELAGATSSAGRPPGATGFVPGSVRQQGQQAQRPCLQQPARQLQEGAETQFLRQRFVQLHLAEGEQVVESHLSQEGGLGRAASCIKRLEPESFSGRVDEYWQWREDFQAMLKGVYSSAGLYMIQLRQHIKDQRGRSMLLGIQDVNVAWNTLDAHYGDKNAAIAFITSRLRQTVLVGAPHERVIDLAQAVQQAVTSLRQVKAGNVLSTDYSIIGALVAKLGPVHQSQYDEHVSLRRGKVCWASFHEWLMLTQDTAKVTRVRELGQQLAQGGDQKKLDQRKSGGQGLGAFSVTVRRSQWWTREDTTRAHLGRLMGRLTSCPLCAEAGSRGVTHMFAKDFAAWETPGSLQWPTRHAKACPTFRSMTVEERGRAFVRHKMCLRCGDTMHQQEGCRRQPPCCQVSIGNPGRREELCQEPHLTALHGCTGTVIKASSRLEQAEDGLPMIVGGAVDGMLPLCNFIGTPPLLAVLSVPTSKGDNVNVMCDEGAQVSLVRHEVGERLSVKPPREWTLNLQVVGQQYRPVKTKLYTITLIDAKGIHRTITAAGIDSVSAVGAQPTPEELDWVRKIFPDIKPGTLNRPQGQIDVLLGVCNIGLLPFGGEIMGNLRLERSVWGEVLRGSCSRLKSRAGAHLLPGALACSRAAVELPEGSEEFTGGPVSIVAFLGLVSKRGAGEELAGLEELARATGGEAASGPRCRDHKDCTRCRNWIEHLTPEERDTVTEMEKGMSVRDGIVMVKYPWIPDNLAKLRNNEFQARKVQSNVEKSLITKGRHGAFTKEMEKALEQGTFSRVPQHEIVERGRMGEPVHYIVLFGVEQPGHAGHKLRIVANSAMKNFHAQLSVNDCIQKPPNALVPLRDVLLWWRSNRHILMVDLARAYQALRTGSKSVEKYTRLFLWRRRPEDAWETYGYDRVTFGDLPAAGALEQAKARAAELGAHIHQETARQLRDKMFSDDGALAADSKEELLRMKGTRQEDGTYDGYISRILGKCGMAPKYIVIAGEKGQEDTLGGAMLGVGYNCASDCITVKFDPIYHKKMRAGVKEEVRLSEGELAELRRGRGSLSLRICLSYVMGQYDPLGLASPLRIRQMLLLRRTHRVADTWDAELPGEVKEAWGNIIVELYRAGTIIFPRAVVPSRRQGDPILVGFGDGSMDGYMAMVYAVWPRAGGGADVFLVTAKARVAPLAGTTVPRMEMCAADLMANLTWEVARSAGFRPAEVVMALDSECTVAALRRRNGLLKPFFAHRAAEVEDAMIGLRGLCSVISPIAAIPGHLNPADIGTRASATPEDIGPSSIFQKGPVFLQWPRKEWPLRLEVGDAAAGIERTEQRLICNGNLTGPQGPEGGGSLPVSMVGAAVRAMAYTNNLDKATRITAIAARALYQGRSKPGVGDGEVSPEEFKMARNLMFMASAPMARAAVARGELRALGPFTAEGTVRLRPRISPDDMQAALGVRELKVVMPGSRLAYLIMNSAHGEDHRRDPRDAMARARRHCWIPRARRLALAVVKACQVCKKEDLKTEQQQMGDLPSFKLSGEPPFTNVGCDFMGPYEVKGMCAGRRFFKVWVAAYTCFSSHATVLLATPGYDAATFVTTHARFCNTYGPPAFILVDHGPNLVAAAERPDWQIVAKTSGWPETTWKITPKACPWRAGQAERVIGMAKKSMHRILDGRGFSGNFHQLEALLARISWLLNARPLAVESCSESDFHLISPNDIILGRAARPRGRVPTQEEMEEPEVVLGTLSHMERVARAWHLAFVKQVWPLYVARCKWKQAKPNVKVGDIGFLLYTSKFGSPTWRPCRVLRVSPDRDGLVRTVTVGLRARLPGDGPAAELRPRPLVEMEIGVQRLAITQPAAEQVASGQGVEVARSAAGQETVGRAAGQPAAKQVIAGREVAAVRRSTRLRGEKP